MSTTMMGMLVLPRMAWPDSTELEPTPEVDSSELRTEDRPNASNASEVEEQDAREDRSEGEVESEDRSEGEVESEGTLVGRQPESSSLFDESEVGHFSIVTRLSPEQIAHIVGTSGVDASRLPPDGRDSGSQSAETAAKDGSEVEFHPLIVEAIRGVPSGRLRLVSDPMVDVYRGTERLGRTPIEIELREGRHRLTFVERGRNLRFSKVYTVRRGERRMDQLVFGMGRLEVLAPAGAIIYLNERLVGVAPVPPLDLFEGRHRLRVVHGETEVREKLTIPPGHTMTYRLAL